MRIDKPHSMELDLRYYPEVSDKDSRSLITTCITRIGLHSTRLLEHKQLLARLSGTDHISAVLLAEHAASQGTPSAS